MVLIGVELAVLVWVIVALVVLAGQMSCYLGSRVVEAITVKLYLDYNFIDRNQRFKNKSRLKLLSHLQRQFVPIDMCDII